jgi:putative component of membrane protein insertase Oxa1/YidC/SpoIIIJ protein YidD
MNAKKAAVSLSILLIQTFRYITGPEYQVCPFTVGCTQYAIQQLETEPFFAAWKNIIHRLLLCNPITNLFKKT